MILILFGNEKQYKIEITQTKEDSKFNEYPIQTEVDTIEGGGQENK